MRGASASSRPLVILKSPSAARDVQALGVERAFA
jgi:hypothetical protein